MTTFLVDVPEVWIRTIELEAPSGLADREIRERARDIERLHDLSDFGLEFMRFIPSGQGLPPYVWQIETRPLDEDGGPTP